MGECATLLEALTTLPKGTGCTVCGFNFETKDSYMVYGDGETVRCDEHKNDNDEVVAIVCGRKA